MKLFPLRILRQPDYKPILLLLMGFCSIERLNCGPHPQILSLKGDNISNRQTGSGRSYKSIRHERATVDSSENKLANVLCTVQDQMYKLQQIWCYSHYSCANPLLWPTCPCIYWNRLVIGPPFIATYCSVFCGCLERQVLIDVWGIVN